jgi:GR25 family glycosyltransferase involved in LPS biosynthesis
MQILLFIILILVFLDIYYILSVSYEHFSDPFDDIDAFIYINLEEKTDRKELLLKEFNRLGIPKSKIRRIAAVRMAKNGHKGCVQSHILALEMAKLNNWNTVAIFEDDARLNVEPDEFKRMVNKALNIKRDVIILHGANQLEKEKIDNELYYLKRSTQSTGYIIKLSYIPKLLELFKDCNNKMSKDGWERPGSWEGNALDQRWNTLIQKDNWIGFKTNLLKQEGESSINGEQKE